MPGDRGVYRGAYMAPRTRTALVAILLALAITVGTALVVRVHEGYIAIPHTCCQDHQNYLAMAGGLPEQRGAESTPPFAYRVLSPAIVRALPVSPVRGFHLLTMASLAAALVLLFYVLRAIGFAEPSAAAGMLLCGSLYWVMEWPQMDFALVDPLSFALFAACLLALYRRAHVAPVAGLICLAVLNKEIGVMLVPVALVVLWRNRRLTAGAAALLCVAPAVTFAALRLLVATHGDYSVSSALHDAVEQRYGDLATAAHDAKTYFLPTWGPSVLIAAAQPQTLWRFVRKRPELLLLYALVHAQLLLAGDTSRLLVIAFVAVVPAVLYCLRESLRREWLVLAAALGIAFIQGFYFEFQRQSVARFANARTSFDASTVHLQTSMAWLMLALAVALAVPVWMRTARPARPAGRPPQASAEGPDVPVAPPAQPL